MSYIKQKLSTYVEIDDNTPIQKLGVLDQLRVVINKLTHDDANELENEDELAIEQAKLRANLSEFIYRATDPIRKGKHKSVVMSVSNHFDPVLEDVLSSREVETFYTFKMVRPNVDVDIPHYILLRLEVKIN